MSAPVAEPGELVFTLAPGAGLYAVHCALGRRFGARAQSGYLWALERGRTGDACIVRRLAGYAPPALAEGERWLFALHARIAQKERATGRRHAWRRTDTARRRRWLDARGAEHGFRIVRATVEAAREPVHKPGARFWLDRSVFCGVLEISDAGKARAALRHGVGGGRAWGLGMLRLLGRDAG